MKRTIQSALDTVSVTLCPYGKLANTTPLAERPRVTRFTDAHLTVGPLPDMLAEPGRLGPVACKQLYRLCYSSQRTCCAAATSKHRRAFSAVTSRVLVPMLCHIISAAAAGLRGQLQHAALLHMPSRRRLRRQTSDAQTCQCQCSTAYREARPRREGGRGDVE